MEETEIIDNITILELIGFFTTDLPYSKRWTCDKHILN